MCLASAAICSEAAVQPGNCLQQRCLGLAGVSGGSFT